MNRNLRRSGGLGALTLTIVLGAGSARAQVPDTAALDALLGQLQKTDAKAWQARAAAMKTAADMARETAVTLRAQAVGQDKAAATETAKARQLIAEIERLAQLRAVIAGLTFSDQSKVPTQAQLEAALGVLRKMPAAAWDARIAAMRGEADKHDKEAARLTQSGATLVAQANAKDAAAKTFELELGKLEQLRKLIGTLAPAVLAETAATPTPTKPAPAKAAPAKAAPPKPAPDKQTDAKTDAKTIDGDFVTYVDHVFPIFEANCLDCHASDDPSSGLDLTSHATTLQGGSSGRTLRPGSPEESRLFLLVAHREQPNMPKDAPRLDDKLIETIRSWIAQGAPKDLPHARKLAGERVVAQQKAAEEAAARQAVELVVQAVMPTELATVRKTWPGRPGALRSVAAAPDAPLLAVPGFHQVLLLHQEGLRELGVLDFPFGQVETLSFSADGTTLLAGGGIPAKQGGAVLYDVKSGRELGRYGKQLDVVLSAAVSPQADLIAVGGTRRKIQVFRASDGAALWEHKHEDWVTAATISGDGQLLASADRQGFVQVREARNGREVHAMKAGEGLLADLAFAPDSATLAVAAADRNVSLWRMRDGRRLFVQRAHGDQVLCITWRAKDRMLSSGADGRVFHWLTNGRRDKELPRIGEWVYDIAASADGTRAFTADWQGRLTAIDTNTGKVLGQVTPLAVTQ